MNNIETKKSLSLQIENYFRVLRGTEKTNDEFSSDSIMAGTFYYCMEIVIKYLNLSDDFLKKYKHIKNVQLNKIENAEEIFVEFKKLVQERKK